MTVSTCPSTASTRSASDRRRGRLFGHGTLLLDVAGERLRFTDVAGVERVQARLHREIGLLAERRRSHEKASEHTARRAHADAAVRGRMEAPAPQRERASL